MDEERGTQREIAKSYRDRVQVTFHAHGVAQRRDFSSALCFSPAE